MTVASRWSRSHRYGAIRWPRSLSGERSRRGDVGPRFDRPGVRPPFPPRCFTNALWGFRSRRFQKSLSRNPTLYGAVNKRDLSTGEIGKLVSENVGFGLNPGSLAWTRTMPLFQPERTQGARKPAECGGYARGRPLALVSTKQAFAVGAGKYWLPGKRSFQLFLRLRFPSSDGEHDTLTV